MAICHFSLSNVSRASGGSCTAKSAYLAAERLREDFGLSLEHAAHNAGERLATIGHVIDYTHKAGEVRHKEIALPRGVKPMTRQQLWSRVEAAEKRKDGRPAKSIIASLPRELTTSQQVELVRSFVGKFTDRGLPVDWAIHDKLARDGGAAPHVHMLVGTRPLSADSAFGLKDRGINAKAFLHELRESFADRTNEALAKAGRSERVDHRSFKDRGIALEPLVKEGAGGWSAEKIAQNAAIRTANGEKLLANPGIVLTLATEHNSSFSRADLAKIINRHTDGDAQFQAVLARVEASPELVRLPDGRHTTREMLQVEQRIASRAEALVQGDHGHLARNHETDPALSLEQQQAVAHVTNGRRLSLVSGLAGSGKSRMLAAARERWQAQGRTVHGCAISGIASKVLAQSSGIESRTVASTLARLDRGTMELTSRSVLVVDEASMVGSKDCDRLLGHVERSGASIVLVGDPQQLAPVAAGQPYRDLLGKYGSAELVEVKRQRAEWMRQATVKMARGDAAGAIQAYDRAGAVHLHGSREDARTALVAAWNADRQARPDGTRLLLAHSNLEVAALNERARASLRETGSLGPDMRFETEGGCRSFAKGDQVLFLRNDRELDVRNGETGTVRGVSPGRLSVAVDGGRGVLVDTASYRDLDHGYALTVHKAQGRTVDRTFIAASPGFDKPMSYVAMSRHTQAVELHASREDFQDKADMVTAFTREDRTMNGKEIYELGKPEAGRELGKPDRGLDQSDNVTLNDRTKERQPSAIDRMRAAAGAGRMREVAQWRQQTKARERDSGRGL